jgi:hypothetical protein
VNGNGESDLSAEVSATASSALPPPYIQARVIRWTLPRPSGVPIQQVRICTDSSCSTPVAGAAVQVSSTVLAWNPAERSPGPANGWRGSTGSPIFDGSRPDAWRYLVEAKDAGKPADVTGYL